VQERFNQAEEIIHTEATMMADLWDATYFDKKSKQTIRSTLKLHSIQHRSKWSLPLNLVRRIEQIVSYKVSGTAIKIFIWTMHLKAPNTLAQQP